MDDASVRERIDELAARAERGRRAFDPPASPPDEERAMRYLREGLGPAIALYVESRTGGRFVHFAPDELGALEDAMNAWLELYARCYGVDLEAEFTVREASELLIETHNVRDVAQLLTDVPDRRDRDGG